MNFWAEKVGYWMFLFNKGIKAVIIKVGGFALSILFVNVWCLAISYSSYISSEMQVISKLLIVNFFMLTAILVNVKLFHLLITTFELNFESREPVLIVHVIFWFNLFVIVIVKWVFHKFNRTEYIIFPLEHHNAIKNEVAHAKKDTQIKHDSSYYLTCN